MYYILSIFIDIKPRVVNTIYNKLDDLAIQELHKTKLGGDAAVVLSEMYPDCLNRLSPDTTDQPHVHRILMIADTKVKFRMLILLLQFVIVTIIHSIS